MLWTAPPCTSSAGNRGSRFPRRWRRPSSGTGRIRRGGDRSNRASSSSTTTSSTPAGESMPRLLLLLLLTLLVPSWLVAAPRQTERRPDPKQASDLPSYIRRVEPAVIGIKVEVPP